MNAGIIPTDVLLTEEDLAEQFVRSFRARRLDEKFFYWFPLSVRAWLALCSDGEYRNYVRSRSIIARTAADVVALLPRGAIEVVSLGSGQGDKDAILLEALASSGRDVAYRPVDASQALLEMACRQALDANVPARGLKADLGRADHRAALAPGPEAPPRLVIMIGNTLGALGPAAAARAVAELLRPEDAFLVDGELYAGEETVAGYDNPINRRFAWAPLHAVGVRDEDGALRFESRDDPELPGLSAVTKHFLAGREVAVMMGGEVMRLAAGERVEMSASSKYTPEAFEGLLDGAGLGVAWRATSDDGRFLMTLARPRG